MLLETSTVPIRQAIATLQASLARHPRRVAAGVLFGLGGFAVTAFGIAPMAAEAGDIPQTVVRHEVELPGLTAQLTALADHELELLRSELTRASDTVDTLLRRLGVSDPLAARFLRQDRDARRLFDGRPGKVVQARASADGSLMELVARFAALDAPQQQTHFTRLTVRRGSDGQLASQVEVLPLAAQSRIATGTVRTTIWDATDDARLPDAVADQLVDMFSGDIDFHRQIQRGDAFRVVYESLTADDQPVTWGDSAGRILAAEFTSRGKTYRALWFADAANGRGGYYSFDGRSRKNAFLASPLPYSRLTSGFAMRLHPILNDWRAHNGVDYGSPLGTPVYSVGDGTVEFAGRQRGYGNVVEVRHDARQSTLYAHLSAIDVQAGQRVQQGQAIGKVGATGYATGPHLHFEFRVDGQFQDPLQMAASSANANLDPTVKQRFQQQVALARQQIDAAQGVVSPRGATE